jgi:5-methylcytosine-specific restriction protein A
VQSSPFYRSQAWKQVRTAVLARDAYRCQLVLPGCYGWANTADHIVERANGGIDAATNLRAVCSNCHNKRHPSKGLRHDLA